MAVAKSNKKFQRKKPGYLKDGRVKIVSLNIDQCKKLVEETSKPKVKAKIENRIRILEQRIAGLV